VTWQKEREKTKNRSTTKEYFPTVAERLQTKIKFTQNLTTIVTCQGEIISYLYRFRIVEAPDCPCGNRNQTVEHILFECGIPEEERTLNSGGGEDGQVANKKNTLIKRHYKAFA